MEVLKDRERKILTYMKDEIPYPVKETGQRFPALFYLQYYLGFLPGRDLVTPRRGRPSIFRPDDPALTSLGMLDSIEKLFGRLKGKTMLIHTPDDLADAITRIRRQGI